MKEEGPLASPHGACPANTDQDWLAIFSTTSSTEWEVKGMGHGNGFWHRLSTP